MKKVRTTKRLLSYNEVNIAYACFIANYKAIKVAKLLGRPIPTMYGLYQKIADYTNHKPINNRRVAGYLDTITQKEDEVLLQQYKSLQKAYEREYRAVDRAGGVFWLMVGVMFALLILCIWGWVR